MELQGDRQEISLRLLQNGKYIWTILLNTPYSLQACEQLKTLDTALQNTFPNHVKPSSVQFKEVEE
jgi:hypothetical protein